MEGSLHTEDVEPLKDTCCGILRLICWWQALAEKVHKKQSHNNHMIADERKKRNYVEFWNIIPLEDPYRLVLSELRDRLFHTREILHHALVHPAYVDALSPSFITKLLRANGSAQYSAALSSNSH